MLKAILKEALKERVPDDLLYAPKRGFGYYIQEADVLSGPWKSRVDAALAEMDDLNGLLNLEGISELKAGFDARSDSERAMLLAKFYAIALMQREVSGATPEN